MLGPAKHDKLQDALAQLKIGDIILINHHKGIFIPQMIHRVSRSYWSHLALVFDVLRHGNGYHDVLLIEAVTNGIQLHRIENYSHYLDHYDIGIKRMKGLTEEERERFRGFFLDAVDTPYDFSRLFSYFFTNLVTKFFGRRITNLLASRVIDVNQYICTTFAQRAFYLAVDKKKREQMLILGESKKLNFLFQMEMITPKDFAVSERAEWLYNPHR